MKSNYPLTPAQAYAYEVVEAVDALIASEPQEEYKCVRRLKKLVMERPRTLRNALNAYLYKSQMQSIQRRKGGYR